MDYETIVGQVVQSARDFRRFDKRRIETAIHGGKYLLQAKDAVQHGDFAALLERAELHERTAQRWMQLARAAWTAQEVIDVGGINAAASKSNERIRENEVLAELDVCKDAVTELAHERDALMADIDPAYRDKIIAELEESRRLRARVDSILDDLNAEAAKRQRFETWAKSHGWTPDRIS